MNEPSGSADLSPAELLALKRALLPRVVYVYLEDLEGRSEIAARLGVSVSTVDAWRRRHAAFPKPMTVLSGAPIWRSWEVTRWSRRPRKPGRPRRAEASPPVGVTPG